MRQVKRCHIKGMFNYLHNPGFPLGIDTGDPERAIFEFAAKGRIESVIAGKLLGCFVPSVSSVCDGAGQDPYRLFSAGQRGCEPADQKGRRTRCRLFMLCVPYAKDVARILYQSMLEAPSGAHERPSPLPGEFNSQKRSIHADVGTARSTQ